MTHAESHLAQFNMAKMLFPLEHPGMADFVARLEAINTLADDAPGFVWRLQDSSGDSTAMRPFGDDQLLVNMSVWESADALFEYAYKSAHAEVFRRRKSWFEVPTEPHLVLRPRFDITPA